MLNLASVLGFRVWSGVYLYRRTMHRYSNGNMKLSSSPLGMHRDLARRSGQKSGAAARSRCLSATSASRRSSRSSRSSESPTPLLTLAVYTVLLKGVDIWYLVASAIGFIAGATNGFIWNRRWTFSAHVGDAYTPVRWGIVQGCGLAVNEVLLFLLVHDAGAGELIAQVLATAVVTVTTFAINRAWTFRMAAGGRSKAG